MQYQRLGLGDSDGDVSLMAPIFLMLGVLGVGGLLMWLTKKNRDDYEYEDVPAVERVKSLVAAIEKDDPED